MAIADKQAKKSQKSHKSPEQLEIENQYYKSRRNLQRRVMSLLKRGYTLPADIIPVIPQKITSGSIRNLEKRTSKYLLEKAVYISEEGTAIPGAIRRGQERREASKKGAEKRRQKWYQEVGTDLSPAGYEIIGTELVPSEGTKSVEWGRVILTNFEGVITDIAELDTIFNSPLNAPSYWGQELREYKEDDLRLLRIGWNNILQNYDENAIAETINKHSQEINELLEAILTSSGDTYVKISGAEHTGMNNRIQMLLEIIKGGPLTQKESAIFTERGEKYGTEQEI